ncbi:Regulator of G-protein signaling 7 [Trichoplax sp. H2]|nr:Regulator of G-protein signaling 7 [Trichoplax sp. H2]|eukprot:RDD43973.1 Regulator of G-protein signaling 7 [Trichoplax sp. H2]
MDTDISRQEILCGKIEKLIQDMQNPVTGLAVKTRKLFLASIPSVFTGTELINWLIKRLDLKETVEAVHLASMFARYGYIYPAHETRQPFAIKYDNTFYRFQIIFNRHLICGLPELLQLTCLITAALVKLQSQLEYNWNSVILKAKEEERLVKLMQLKDKLRNKAERSLSYSEQRCFWRVRQPPSYDANMSEAGFRRLNSTPKDSKRTLISEAEALRKMIEGCAMKVSKGVESVINNCEKYKDYDPFLPTTRTSNPWITDKITEWNLNSVNATVLHKRRVLLWAVSLADLLRDDIGVTNFIEFASNEHSEENINFWLDCENLIHHTPMALVPSVVHDIYGRYLTPSSPQQINIDASYIRNIDKSLYDPNKWILIDIQKKIYYLMERNSYRRFIESEEYQSILESAIEVRPRKKYDFLIYYNLNPFQLYLIQAVIIPEECRLTLKYKPIRDIPKGHVMNDNERLMRRRTSSSTGPFTVLEKHARNGQKHAGASEIFQPTPNRNSDLFRIGTISKSRSFNDLEVSSESINDSQAIKQNFLPGLELPSLKGNAVSDQDLSSPGSKPSIKAATPRSSQIPRKSSLR